MDVLSIVAAGLVTRRLLIDLPLEKLALLLVVRVQRSLIFTSSAACSWLLAKNLIRAVLRTDYLLLLFCKNWPMTVLVVRSNTVSCNV